MHFDGLSHETHSPVYVCMLHGSASGEGQPALLKACYTIRSAVHSPVHVCMLHFGACCILHLDGAKVRLDDVQGS